MGRVRKPVRISELSEPQPDVAVLRSRADEYGDAHPGPKDVLLLIEVADTPFDKERGKTVAVNAILGKKSKR
ncbi:MAG: hypothetical protein AMXMBFR7_46210 [Planctomycetota bacterium]